MPPSLGVVQRSDESDEQVRMDLEVRFGDRTFPYLIRPGTQNLPEVGNILADLDASQIILAFDTGVPVLVTQAVHEALADVTQVIDLPVSADETQKNWDDVGRLADTSLKRKGDRGAVVVALGGGVVGNKAGLLAHLFFRGVPLVHLPTTWPAATDSVFSFKQAVNTDYQKNGLGSFHENVVLVVALLDVLMGTSANDRIAAICETVKNVTGICPDQAGELAARLRPDTKYTPDFLAWLIRFDAEAKMSVMRRDPHERTKALVLELGHTFAHAIEMVTRGALPHGIAVGLGLLIAAREARAMGITTDDTVETMTRTLLTATGAPVTFDEARLARQTWSPRTVGVHLPEPSRRAAEKSARGQQEVPQAAARDGPRGAARCARPGAPHPARTTPGPPRPRPADAPEP